MRGKARQIVSIFRGCGRAHTTQCSPMLILNKRFFLLAIFSLSLPLAVWNSLRAQITHKPVTIWMHTCAVAPLRLREFINPFGPCLEMMPWRDREKIISQLQFFFLPDGNSFFLASKDPEAISHVCAVIMNPFYYLLFSSFQVRVFKKRFLSSWITPFHCGKTVSTHTNDACLRVRFSLSWEMHFGFIWQELRRLMWPNSQSVGMRLCWSPIFSVLLHAKFMPKYTHFAG